MDWHEARTLWDAKGYKLESVAEEIEQRFGKRRGLSKSSISANSKPVEKVPEDVAEFIRALDVLPGSEARYTEYLARQATLSAGRAGGGTEPVVAPVDPEAIAASVADRLPRLDVDELAANVADRLPKPDVEQLAIGVATRLPPIDVEQLAAGVAGKMPKADVDRLAAAIARRLARRTWGAAALVVLGLGAFTLLLRGPAASPPPSSVTVNVGPGLLEQAARARRDTLGVELFREFLGKFISGAQEMDKKAPPPERYIPKTPLPRQKRPPCDAGIGESDVNGGCWFGSADVKPPCGRLYRHGDTCYRPVAEDPEEPVGGGAQWSHPWSLEEWMTY